MDHYTSPYLPKLAPITLLTDIAVPISMACRLCGNMLSGLIVMDLIYQVLPIAIPRCCPYTSRCFTRRCRPYLPDPDGNLYSREHRVSDARDRNIEGIPKSCNHVGGALLWKSVW